MKLQGIHFDGFASLLNSLLPMVSNSQSNFDRRLTVPLTLLGLLFLSNFCQICLVKLETLVVASVLAAIKRSLFDLFDLFNAF